MKSLQVREIQSDPELDAIYQLRLAAWRSVNPCLPADSDACHVERDESSGTHVGAFIGETLVGAAHLRVYPCASELPVPSLTPTYARRFEGPVGHMGRLVVHPEFRRRGIARELVAWMMCRAHASQAAWAVALTTVPSVRNMLVVRGFGCMEPVRFFLGQSAVSGAFLWRRLTSAAHS